ncbi:hypothetical protein WJX82_003103 [Trebouxia sp. C0006]
MTQPSQTSTTMIAFHGVQLAFPATLPFSHQDGCLVLDFSLGYTGKLVIKPVSGSLAAASPTLHVAQTNQQPQHQGLATCHPSFSGHLSQHNDLSQGPQEEFCSPQEHFHSEPAEQADSVLSDTSIPRVKHATDNAQQAADPLDAQQAADADITQQHPDIAEEDEHPPKEAATAAKRRQLKQKAEGKTPLQTKTPANPKRRKGNRSVPSSSKRRKATPVALGDASFAWRALDSDWSKGEAGPGERWGSSLTCLPHNKVCLLGGADSDGHLSDAWILDVGQAGWSRLPSADLPSTTAWHSAYMLQCDEGEQLVVYGGESPHKADENEAGNVADAGNKVYNDLVILEPDMRLWIGLSVTGEAGKPLPARTGHSCTVLPEGRLLIFGGMDDAGKFKNDMFVIDIKRLVWFGMKAKGAPPKGRAYHSATAVGGRVVIMGGQGTGDKAWSLKEVYTLNTDAWKWTEHTSEVEGEAPSPRYGHTTLALPDDRHLATFGGCDSRQDMFFSNVALLDTLTWRWSTPKIQGMARPSGRSGHSMALASLPDNKAGLVVFGGASKNDLLHNDTWLLELPKLP